MLQKSVNIILLIFLIKTTNGLVSQTVTEINSYLPTNSYTIAESIDPNYFKPFTFLDLIQQRQIGNKVEQVNEVFFNKFLI